MAQSTKVSASEAKTSPSAHVALAVVFQVLDGVLQVLLWQRAKEPHEGAWALPGGYLAPDETLEQSIRRHLAAKVDVRELGRPPGRALPLPLARTGDHRPVRCAAPSRLAQAGTSSSPATSEISVTPRSSSGSERPTRAYHSASSAGASTTRPRCREM